MPEISSDHVTVLTGATSGIGRVAAGTLARRGGTLILVGRNPELGRAAVEQLTTQTGNPAVSFQRADLSSLADIRRLAMAIRERHDRVDLLVNNAGAIFTRRRTTAEGLEATFALNHMAYFLLSLLLLEPMRRAAPARLVNVASEAHRNASLPFDDLQSERRYSGWGAYQRSKLANILFTREFARRHADTGIVAACLHPGFIASRFGDENGGLFRLALGLAKRVAAESAEVGGGRVADLATAADPEPGAYYVRNRPALPAEAARSDEAAARLWAISTDFARPWLEP